jgi:hypothetical protein
LGAIVLRGVVSGRADTHSKADAWLVGRVGIAGIAITVTSADGWIGLPFVAGSLPDEITATVWVSSELTAGVSVDVVVASVTAESLGAEVEIDTAGATIETNEISAEVR